MATSQYTQPVPMVALERLYQAVWSGRLPDVLPGEPFWADSSDQPNLINAGLARNWQEGDPALPGVEPPYTANQIPGFGAGTSNSSPA